MSNVMSDDGPDPEIVMTNAGFGAAVVVGTVDTVVVGAAVVGGGRVDVIGTSVGGTVTTNGGTVVVAAF